MTGPAREEDAELSRGEVRARGEPHARHGSARECDESREASDPSLATRGRAAEAWSSAEMTVGNTRFDGTEGSDGPELCRGTSLGRYVVLDRLGAGGMGVVWGAYDPELDRKVAVKAVRLQGSQESNAIAHARLLREAQALARLSHPNVVAVYDVQMWEGQVCVAMEFVSGKTLGAWMKAGARSQTQVLAVLCAAGEGVVAAHKSGLVHRDLKPDNVMVDDEGRVRVMDFGLVRETVSLSGSGQLSGDDAALLETGSRQRTSSVATASVASSVLKSKVNAEPASTAATDRGSKQSGGHDDAHGDPQGSSRTAVTQELTRAGALLGTPAYMSPEQFAGAEADGQSDQFSFCVMAWEALYGERPFAGRSLAELAGAVALGQLRMPSDRAAASRAAKVPSHIRSALLRGLSVDPEERWPTLQNLLGELRRDPRVRRRRGVALLLGGGLMAALVAGYSIDRGVRFQRCRKEADAIGEVWNETRAKELERAFVETGSLHASKTAALTIAFLDGYQETWTELSYDACVARSISRTRPMQLATRSRDCFERSQAQFEALVSTLLTPDVEAVNAVVGRAHALPLLADCVDNDRLLRAVDLPADPAIRSEVLVLYREAASVSTVRGSEDLEVAQARIAKTLERAQETKYVPLIVEAMADQGMLLELKSEFEAAQQQLTVAFVLAASASDDATPHELAIHLSMLAATRQRESKAAHHWLTVAEFLRARLPSRAPAVDAKQEIAAGYVELLDSRAQDALPHFVRAHELHQSVYGPTTPGGARIQGYIATAYYELGEYEQALEWDLRGLETLTETIGPSHPALSSTYSNVGLLLQELGRLDEARTMLERAAKLEREYGGDNSAFLADVLTNQGVLESHAGNPEAALGHWQRAYEIWVSREGPTHPDVALARGNLAVAYLALNRLDEAEREVKAALEGYKRQEVPDPLLILRAQTNLAHIAIRRENWVAARRYLDAALLTSPAEERHPERAAALHELARCDLHDGDAQAAVAHARQALELREERLGPNHAESLRSRLMLVRALRRLGAAPESRSTWQQIATLRSKATDVQLDDVFSTDLEGLLWRRDFEPESLTRVAIQELLTRAKATPDDSLATIEEIEALLAERPR